MFRLLLISEIVRALEAFSEYGQFISVMCIPLSFAGEDLRVVGEEASVTLQAHKDDLQPPRLTLSRAGVSVENVHDLSLLDPNTGEVVFSTSDPELRLPEGVRHLETEETEVDRVVSGVEDRA